MLVKVINCKQIFTNDFVEEIKDQIKRYNQGFMIAGNELYIPYYQILRMKYTLPKPCTADVINVAGVTNTDQLASHFKQTNTLDVEEIIDLYHAMQLNDDFGELLDVVNEIAEQRYELGYSDAEE